MAERSAPGATAVSGSSAEPPEPGDGRRELPPAVLVRFRAGDADALGEVYDRYSRSVWAVAMTVTRADHLAQEALQETFIRAWRSASTYDPERDLGPWLLTIARYTALDLIRRELRPTRGGHEAEQDAVVEAPDLDVAWLSWTVQEALRQLAEHEREIIRLSFFDDLTHAQIAQRLDLPLGTVKSRSHRAHRRLAELLAHVRDPPPLGDGANQSGTAGRTTIGTAGSEGRSDG
ncbi:sigma-70 family RNA polymerase sigma factor [Verrucosispora sp. WMMA2121]|uniref:RNA polymerase sigma factor n=1 Tax=Verrucosispora sp. WMMA2121 TaxID=3015164 RepID=UPI0022B6055C|nr:sigma-70 family RNA polymerase sigma factor [Verrucosispora sp. WMMA2121]MCZ7423545.1 sigma-70 family RNA polymerase sigma factor [Verrucosispora sp. WMMA2121]